MNKDKHEGLEMMVKLFGKYLV